MPGGGLTQPERQQIALGLAGGPAYAEIARQSSPMRMADSSPPFFPRLAAA